MNVLIPCALLVAIIALSLAVSKPNWPFHPGGARGYITDMLLYYFLPVAPMVVCIIGFRIALQIKPELENNTSLFIMMGIAIIGLVGARRLPVVVAAQNRVRDARNARFEAMKP